MEIKSTGNPTLTVQTGAARAPHEAGTSLLPPEDRLTHSEAGELHELQRHSLVRAQRQAEGDAVAGVGIIALGGAIGLMTPLFGIPIMLCGAALTGLALLERGEHRERYEANLKSIEALASPPPSHEDWNLHS